MANKLVVYNVEDSETGQIYKVEGPEGATADELGEFILSQKPALANVTPAANAAPTAPVEASAPAGPSGVQNQQQLEEYIAPGINTQGEPFRFPDEVAGRITAAAADPNVSWDQYNQLIKDLQREYGQPALGAAGGAKALEAYRSAPPERRVGVGYQDWKDSIDLPVEATATADSAIARAYQDAVQYGTPGWLARSYHDWMGTGMEALRQRFPDATPEQLEALQEDIISHVQRRVREQNVAATANDPLIPWLAGQVIGSAGIEDFIPFAAGGSLAGRTVKAAGINAAADVGYQAADVVEGVQDEINPAQVAASAGLGAGLHLGIEGASTVARKVSRGQAPAEIEPVRNIQIPTSRKNSRAYKTEIDDAGIAIADHINSLSEGWTNAPEFIVHRNFKDLKGIDNDSIGVTTPEGKVLINAENVIAEAKAKKVSPEDIVAAVTFHEALGHHGLAQKFGDDLESVLSDFYENSVTSFRDKVDNWLKNNPTAYQGASNRELLAAEEVLAEMSEAGRLPVTFVNRITNLLKDFARTMGLDLKFSEREIKTILGMAHNAVINGKGRDVRGNGFRYMTPARERAFIEYMYARNRSPAELYDELERGVNPEAEAEISVRASQLRQTSQDVSGRVPSGYDDSLAVDLINRADADPGKVHTERMWYDIPNIVDFRYVDPETRSTVYGAFKQEGDTATGFEIYGDSPNAVGPKVIQTIRRQLREIFPEIKKVDAIRISGARNKGREVPVKEGTPVRVQLSKYMRRRTSAGERFRPETPPHVDLVEVARAYLYEKAGMNGADFRNMSKDEIINAASRAGLTQEYADWYSFRRVDENGNIVSDSPHPEDDDFWGDWLLYMKRRTREVSEEEQTRNAKEILQGVLDSYEPTYRSWAEAKAAARDRGLTAKQIRKAKGIQDLDKRLFQYDAVADATDQQLVALHEKMNNGTFTMRDKARYLETVFSYNELLGRIFDDQAEIGRALNAMKALDFTKRKITDLNQILEEFQGNNVNALADNKVFDAFVDRVRYLMETGNTAGAHSMIRSVLKPYWWQYILSFRHAMMLSGLGTHAKNATDNAMIIARELEEQALAVPGFVIRKGLRSAGFNVKEGVSPQEVAGRLYGLLRAAFDGATYKNTFNAFREGYGNTEVSSKLEMQNAVIPGVSKVQDALHAADTFFRAFHNNANLYTIGVRQARADGFRGKAAFEEGSNRAANPTPEMLEEAQKMADVLLLVDTPSGYSDWIEWGKSIKPGMNAGQQARAFFLNLVFPFFRVTDRLLFQQIRRSPISFLDKVTREEFASGGARRDVAIARTLYGSALMYYYWLAAGEGEIEGQAPADYEKRQALEAGGYLPNSVKRDGKYVDASALNLSFLPSDTQNAVATNIASIRKAYETGKADRGETADALAAAAQSLLTVLASASFAENISLYLDPFRETEEYQKDAAIANLGGALGSSFVPAAVRQYNQMYHDTTKRDTTGDKTIGDRIYGRIASGIPGLSDDLPAKYDLYGDKMEQGRTALGFDNYQTIKTDEMSRELQRLERTTDSPVVTGAPASFQHEGELIRLNAAGRQEWQRVQGYYFRYWMEEEIQSPGWKSLSDEEKIAVVKDVRSDAYYAAKEYMLPLLGVATNEEE